MGHLCGIDRRNGPLLSIRRRTLRIVADLSLQRWFREGFHMERETPVESGRSTAKPFDMTFSMLSHIGDKEAFQKGERPRGATRRSLGTRLSNPTAVWKKMFLFSYITYGLKPLSKFAFQCCRPGGRVSIFLSRVWVAVQVVTLKGKIHLMLPTWSVKKEQTSFTG